MTILVGVVEGDHVVIAVDSYAVDGEGLRWHNPNKCIELPAGDDRVLIAVAGRTALQRVIRDGLTIEAAPSSDPLDQEKWAQAIACSITQLAVEHKITDKDGDIDGACLLAWRHRLWDIGDHLAFPINRWSTSGVGRLLALGALEVLDNGELPGEELARRSAEVACKHHTGCTLPIIVRSTADPASPTA